MELLANGVQSLGVTSTTALISCVSNGSAEGPDGFPRIPESSFQTFRDEVPHLFTKGRAVLDWIDAFGDTLARSNEMVSEGRLALQGAAQALGTMVQTAAVTAPPDLWLQRQILAAHARSGLLGRLEAGEVIASTEDRLSYDLQFLWTRGLLEYSGPGYVKSPSCPYPLDSSLTLPPEFRTDMTGLLCAGFNDSLSAAEESLIARWLALPAHPNSPDGWMAGRQDLEVGYRLLPVVLGLHASGALKGLRKGTPFPEIPWRGLIGDILSEAGLLEAGLVTALGARVFERGPGIFGIIGAYHTYMNSEDPWVERGKNIAASRDANRRSFETAAEIIEAAGLNPSVVIEHALGLGVGIQTFQKRLGGKAVQFIGADYEQTALDGARREQKEGRLPTDMKFVRADIGRPDTLLDFLRLEGIDSRGAVMIVGNGFHEARGLSDEEMAAMLRGYREAGVHIVFTEESGLTDDQIRTAAWNTYHAGFRYTHQISGQVPRAPWPMDPPSPRLSWTEVFERAGYRVPREFRRGTRPVFPCDLPEEKNPPISVTFLCIP